MPHILVRSDERSHRAAELISSLVQWMARLPYEPTSGKKKGKFSGLRGPVEQAIIAVSEQPEDASRWQELLLMLAQVQKQIDWDGTRGWRQRSAPFPRLSQAWLDFAWPDGRPQEIEIATAIASVGGGTLYPLACNIYGVKPSKEGFWLLWDSASPKWKIKLLPLPFEMSLSIKLMGTSRCWESVTPFVPPRQRRRFRKNGKERPGETPESIAAKLCQRIYGITPLSITSEVSEEWPYVHVGTRERGQKNRQRMTLPSFRLVVEFTQPVTGPIALGDSSHFGLGLFAPVIDA